MVRAMVFIRVDNPSLAKCLSRPHLAAAIPGLKPPRTPEKRRRRAGLTWTSTCPVDVATSAAIDAGAERPSEVIASCAC